MLWHAAHPLSLYRVAPRSALIESALNQLFVFVTREVDDLRHAQTLHEKIEKAVRQRRPEAHPRQDALERPQVPALTRRPPREAAA